MKRAAAAVAFLTLAFPAVASAHAVLIRTVPLGNKVLPAAPSQVQLIYSEPIEPKFAIVSVTDAGGNQVTAGPPESAPSDRNTLIVPLNQIPQGWYLVYWRVISADGHPVRGAFTFAVGPNAGPAPEFVIPSISETAATPTLVILRWIVLLSLMAAVGLFVMRTLIARRLVRLRWVTTAWAVAAGVAIVSNLVYVDVATAKFALRSSFDLGALIPLMHDSLFGRGYLTLELCLILFAYAGGIAIWLDRPERPKRTIAALLALVGALAAAAAAILAPAVAGHAGQTSPRGVAIPVDWVHIAAGAVWIGGLAGLLVIGATLGVPALVRVVPRFSTIAFFSVVALVAAGIGNSLFHLPTLASLWETSYGKMVSLKIVVLAVALLVASGNFLRNAPRLRAAERRPDLVEGAASLLRKLVTVEVVLVVGIIFCAALLTSLAPPSQALAEVGRAKATVGPGPAARTVEENGYTIHLNIAPNRAAVENAFSIKLTKDGQPVTGARVTTGFSMLDMEMGTQSYQFRETAPGVYSKSSPALVMVGHWGIAFTVEPRDGKPFTVFVVDKAGG